MADGPVIQKAGEKGPEPGRWHGAGAGPGARIPQDRNNTTRGADGLRQPVERYDQKHGTPGTTGSAFVRDAAAAGVDGVLIVDYPPEECEPLPPTCAPTAWT